MNTWSRFIGAKSSIIAIAFGLSTGAAFAAATANDTASNYSGGGWGTTPPNDGTGFGSWNVTVDNNNGPPYVGTYLAGSGTGNSGTPIVDGGGNAWGVYANGGSGTGEIILMRPFTTGSSGSASLYNQTLSFELGSGGVGPGQGLLSVEIGNAFDFQYIGSGVDDFEFNDPSTAGDPANTGVDFSELSAGIDVSLMVSGALNSTSENYTFTVSPFVGGSPLYSTSGTFDSSSFNTASFNLTDANTTGNGYFNNLNITPEAAPEPAIAAFLGISGLGAVLMRRRRK